MLKEIVESLNMNSLKKQIYMKMADDFETNLPDSLYYTAYDLTDIFYGNIQEWKEFLKIPEVNRFVETEIAEITEVGARKALSNLQSKNVASADISAAKQLLDNSRLLKQKMNQFQQFVVTRIPAKERSNGASDEANAD